jgi:hypothetical protein
MATECFGQKWRNQMACEYFSRVTMMLDVIVLALLIETSVVNQMHEVCERETLKTEMLLEIW